MNPFKKPIKFTKAKENHFYAIKSGDKYLKVEPEIGDIVYEVPVISGGEARKPLLLQIPIPSCEKHFKLHNGKPFGVKTCQGWEYIAIPSPLGSLRCRECNDELFLPEPFLHSANLSSANLSSANLHSANLHSANLHSANLSSANLHSANLSSANLHSANLHSADLSFADLSFADLSFADLSFANLHFANLHSADLSFANLHFADLSFANLSFADLSSADLHSARNINESINLDKSYWNNFTEIDNEFKKLLNKKRFLE